MTLLQKYVLYCITLVLLLQIMISMTLYITNWINSLLSLYYITCTYILNKFKLDYNKLK